MFAKSKRKNANGLPNLTEGPLFSRIFTYSVPIMLSGLLQLLYNSADQVVIGQFSHNDNALAAVGSTGSLTNLLIALVLGLSVGASVCVARDCGAKNDRRLHDSVHTSMSVSVISGFIVAIAGFFFCRPLLELMGTRPECINEATLYMKIFFCGMPANAIYNFGAGILRSTGDTKRPMYILLATGLINVICNCIFVIAFNMDVEGVAIATIIAQYLSAISVVWLLRRQKDGTRLQLSKLSLKMSILKDIVKIGLPSGIQTSCFSLSNVIIQSAINTFPVAVVNGNTVGSTIEGFVYIAMNAFYHASLTFTGQNYGAKKLDRIKKTLYYSVIQATLTGIAVGMVCYIFREQLAFLVKPDEAIAQAACARMAIILPTYFLCGIMEALAGQMRGLGYSTTAMFASLFGACVLRILWIEVVFKAMGYNTPMSIYISYPITWVVTVLIYVVALIVIHKKMKKKFSV